MKKFILPYIGLIVCLFVLTGCDDNSPRLKKMDAKYPDSDFAVNPLVSYQYIVRKQDNSVWEVRSYLTESSECQEVLLIPAPKK